MNSNMQELERLFKYFSISEDISHLAKVQTLLSRYNQDYDTIIKLYNER